MNAIPPILSPGSSSCSVFSERAAGASSHKWAALHDAADLIAALAGIEPEPPMPEPRNFPAVMHGAAPWRRELANRGIEDMAAVIGPGIAALLGVDVRGGDPRPAALALWREFVEARSAVLALLPPSGALELVRGA